MGEWGITPLILNLGTIWVSGQLYTSSAKPQVKESSVPPLSSKLSGHQRQSECIGEETSFLLFPEILPRPFEPSFFSLVTVVTAGAT